MPWKVNSKNKAKSLISSGDIDFDSSWSFSSSDGNKLLGESGDDWSKYASVHLAENTDAEQNTKNRYGYPVAKLKGNKLTIYRRGVIAAKGAASGARGAEKNTAIFNLASNLLDSIDKKVDSEDILKCPECGTEIDKTINECPECGAKLDACKTKKKKKTDSFLNVQRFDIFDDPNDYMETKFEETTEGYLRGRAKVTNIGVFSYLNSDGSIRRELRLPEEVFDNESLKTLELKPISDDHPNEQIINIDNIKDHQIGSTGGNVRYDNYHVSIPIIISPTPMHSRLSATLNAGQCQRPR